MFMAKPDKALQCNIFIRFSRTKHTQCQLKMSSRDKAHTTAGESSRPATSKATRRTISSSSSKTNRQQQAHPTQPTTTTSISANTKKGKKDASSPLISPSPASSKHASRNSASKVNKPVISSSEQPKLKSDPTDGFPHQETLSKGARVPEENDETSSSSQEMTMTNLHDAAHSLGDSVEKETNIDRPHQQLETDDDDDESATRLESSSSDIVQRLPTSLPGTSSGSRATLSTDNVGILSARPTAGKTAHIIDKTLDVLYHDDEEINMSSPSHLPRRTSSDDSEYLESGAALTTADDPTTVSDAITFAVYPTGSCEFDETQLISTQSTKAIQKCILRLMSHGTHEAGESGRCWDLDPTQPIMMRLLDDHIQFSDIDTHSLLRSQPIQTIKTWAVDDDNNFAFVVEDQHDSTHANRLDLIEDHAASTSVYDSVDYALLNGPTFMCYVFSSVEDDDMSIKVAAKLNAEINRYRELMSQRVSKSTRMQQMVETNPLRRVIAQGISGLVDNDQTDIDGDDFDDAVTTVGEDDDDDDLEESSEMTLRVKYIGKVQVPRPMGIDVLNVAIDKSLAEASKAQMDRLLNSNNRASAGSIPISTNGQLEIGSPLTDAKIHVSPSSVIVENEQTGDIIVECRIRYLTFMGISRRDIRWCGFIMQNTTNKTFEAHCIECTPTAGHVCETIQASCTRMYEKMVKGQRRKQQLDEAISIMPRTSKIRDTLAKTLSKIKLAPIIQ